MRKTIIAILVVVICAATGIVSSRSSTINKQLLADIPTDGITGLVSDTSCTIAKALRKTAVLFRFAGGLASGTLVSKSAHDQKHGKRDVSNYYDNIEKTAIKRRSIRKRRQLVDPHDAIAKAINTATSVATMALDETADILDDGECAMKAQARINAMYTTAIVNADGDKTRSLLKESTRQIVDKINESVRNITREIRDLGDVIISIMNARFDEKVRLDTIQDYQMTLGPLSRILPLIWQRFTHWIKCPVNDQECLDDRSRIVYIHCSDIQNHTTEFLKMFAVTQRFTDGYQIRALQNYTSFAIAKSFLDSQWKTWLLAYGFCTSKKQRESGKAPRRAVGIVKQKLGQLLKNMTVDCLICKAKDQDNLGWMIQYRNLITDRTLFAKPMSEEAQKAFKSARISVTKADIFMGHINIEKKIVTTKNTTSPLYNLKLYRRRIYDKVFCCEKSILCQRRPWYVSFNVKYEYCNGFLLIIKQTLDSKNNTDTYAIKVCFDSKTCNVDKSVIVDSDTSDLDERDSLSAHAILKTNPAKNITLFSIIKELNSNTKHIFEDRSIKATAYFYQHTATEFNVSLSCFANVLNGKDCNEKQPTTPKAYTTSPLTTTTTPPPYCQEYQRRMYLLSSFSSILSMEIMNVTKSERKWYDFIKSKWSRNIQGYYRTEFSFSGNEAYRSTTSFRGVPEHFTSCAPCHFSKPLQNILTIPNSSISLDLKKQSDYPSWQCNSLVRGNQFLWKCEDYYVVYPDKPPKQIILGLFNATFNYDMRLKGAYMVDKNLLSQSRIVPVHLTQNSTACTIRDMNGSFIEHLTITNNMTVYGRVICGKEQKLGNFYGASFIIKDICIKR